MSSKGEREKRKALLLSQLQQQRLDLSASRRDWLETNQDDENHNDSNDDDMFYINISIPLGEQRVGAYMRNQGDKTTY
ncbi:hypothetical protein ONK27_26465, partial [Salmonella enterica subsp. enterica serovar Virginia]|nr:hypothetical protein [Salmonella enterica subsp. enterica serovar Virginia]